MPQIAAGPEPNPPQRPTTPEAPSDADPGSLDDQARENRPPAPPIQEPAPPETPPNVEPRTSRIADVNISLKFIAALQNATLDNAGLDPDLLHRIRNPPSSILSVDDPDERLSIDVFLAIGNASEASYAAIRTAILRRNPENEKMLSYYRVQRLVSELTGVVPIEQDMCTNSCIGYTGLLCLLQIRPHTN